MCGAILCVVLSTGQIKCAQGCTLAASSCYVHTEEHKKQQQPDIEPRIRSTHGVFAQAQPRSALCSLNALSRADLSP